MPTNSSNVKLGSTTDVETISSGYVTVNKQTKRALKHSCQSDQKCIHNSVYGNESDALHSKYHREPFGSGTGISNQQGCSIM